MGGCRKFRERVSSVRVVFMAWRVQVEFDGGGGGVSALVVQGSGEVGWVEESEDFVAFFEARDAAADF